MTSDQKKALLLQKAVILQNQGLDAAEKKLLEATSLAINGSEELDWTFQFILQDSYTAFERARIYLNEVSQEWTREARLGHLNLVWQSVNEKGYISEIEATAILKMAKDWQMQRELINLVRKR